TLRRVGAIAAVGCIGAAAGIAGSAAAPSGGSKHLRLPGPVFGFAGPGLAAPIGGPVVHAELVVANGSGGFETLTIDRGTVESVSGSQVVLNEGTKSATYKMLTLTIPAAAHVDRNGAAAQLSALQHGDFATVVQASKGTRVEAFA